MNSNHCTHRSKRKVLNRRRRRSAGMTLPELLVGLAIGALMLAAIATAFDAGLKSYAVNQDMTIAGRSARNVMNRMAGSIRSAWNDPAINAIVISEAGDECSLLDADDREVVYWYDSEENELEMSIDDGENWHVLLRGVSELPGGEPIFSGSAPVNPDFAAGVIGRVDIRLQVQQGATIYPVCTSVVPRNVLYN